LAGGVGKEGFLGLGGQKRNKKAPKRDDGIQRGKLGQFFLLYFIMYN